MKLYYSFINVKSIHSIKLNGVKAYINFKFQMKAKFIWESYANRVCSQFIVAGWTFYIFHQAFVPPFDFFGSKIQYMIVNMGCARLSIFINQTCYVPTRPISCTKKHNFARQPLEPAVQHVLCRSRQAGRNDGFGFENGKRIIRLWNYGPSIF